jgi:nitrate reductase delta subunit
MRLYELFAEILDYPGPHLTASVQDCAALLRSEFPEGAELLGRFGNVQAGVPLGQLQEAYTSIFDMQPECTLNLGYQLLGDDWRRSILLFKLKEVYQARNFDSDSDLPDHLCILLRFLGSFDDSKEPAELVDDCLLPALSRIAPSVQLGESPYRWVLQALLSWLREHRKTVEPGHENRDGRQANATMMRAKERTA